MTLEGRRIQIRGTVQGVGFRPWVYRVANELGLRGRVLNGGLGVRIDAFGDSARLDQLVDVLTGPGPGAAQVIALEWEPLSPADTPEDVPLDRFVIAASEAGTERRPSIPPDLATCPDCLAEILDPGCRRYRYAFTNCTSCGPRFTIAQDVPYDRRGTTMASFEMCTRCRTEYEWVADRRFHAQPNACPTCGPQLEMWSPSGRKEPVDDVVLEAARALVAGQIVAIKGLGGFHLACDATSDAVVRELRLRKRRDEKPFAVMVSDLETARRYAVVDDEAAALLTSVERPIVLVPRVDDPERAASPIAESVAPGVARLGLMLPYTPLHHLLMRDVEENGGPGALVMTSGNVSDTPIATTNDEAVERLGSIADRLVVHDRPIENRADDSVAAVMAGAPVVLRRSRGYVPRPVLLRAPVTRPILACGGDLKNAFCIASGELAFLGPHIGDLDDASTFESFVAGIEQLERFVGIVPERIAYDLHPRYHASRYALTRAADEGIEAVGVQHHHAHIASVAAEHGVDGPVLGFAWDGTGYGTDGTAWGGELLLVDEGGYQRLASTRPIALPGGDVAIKQVWRLVLAALGDAWGGRPNSKRDVMGIAGRLAVFGGVPSNSKVVVQQMCEQGINCPLGRGIGRLFDAVGAIALNRPESAFEGQVAMALEAACSRLLVPGQSLVSVAGQGYEVAIDWSTDPWELDFRPTLRQVVSDTLARRDAGLIAARFHLGLVEAAVELLDAAERKVGRWPVGLSGGCFQNAVLVDELLARLEGRAEVLVHRQVPPNDGGLALGQILVANAAAATNTAGES